MMKSFVADKWKGGSTFSLDADALASHPDLIDLSIGDADFTTDPAIIDAAFADAHAGYTHYGYPQGDPELVAAIVDYWATDFDQEVSPENILVTPSSALGMTQTLLATINDGDEVIVFSPYFPVYRQQISLAGGVVVDVPLNSATHYAIDPEALRAAITPRTKAIIFNNPTNPTGVVHTRSSYEAIAEVAKEFDLLVIADEIYTDFVFDADRPFIAMRSLPEMADRTVTLNSFSKNYMMAGWRVGYVVAHPELVAAISMVSDSLEYTTTSVSQRAAIRALEMRETIRNTYIREFGERLAYVSERLSAMPYIDLVKPMGTFYIFPSIAATGMSGAEFRAHVLREARVLVSAGEVFGKAGNGHIRVACTVPMDKLVEACDRLERLRF